MLPKTPTISEFSILVHPSVKELKNLWGIAVDSSDKVYMANREIWSIVYA